MKLNLGCGPDKRPGYVNVDIDPAVAPDVVGSVACLPFRTASAEQIEAFHLIEHMLPWDAEQALAEWRRVLKPGGGLVLECPDLRKVCTWLFLSGDFTPYAALGMRGLFGDVATANPYMLHRWGYTASNLTRLLEGVGYVDVRVKAPSTHHAWRDMRLEARSPTTPPGPHHAALDVFWLLCGDMTVASSRLQGYMVHRFLREAGVSSHLLLAPPFPITDIPWRPEDDWLLARVVKASTVMIQKLRGPRTEHLVRFLRGTGATTVFIQSDYDPDNRVPFLCDVVICSSTSLCDYYRAAGAANVIYIPDSAEVSYKPARIRRRPDRTRELTICWVGHSDNWGTIEPLRLLLAEPDFADFRLLTVSNHPDADLQWSPAAVDSAVAASDLAAIPTGTGPQFTHKSSNRVLMFMGRGLPVVAGRIPAYEQVIDHGSTGYLAGGLDDWRICLAEMRCPRKRQDIAVTAHRWVRANYSREQVLGQWLDLLTQLGTVPKPAWMRAMHDDRRASQAERSLRLNALLDFTLNALTKQRYWCAFKSFTRAAVELPVCPAAYPAAARVSRQIVAGGLRRLVRPGAVGGGG